MSYVTTGRRMALGLAGGALSGAALFSLYLVLAWPPGGSSPILLVIFIYAAVIWSIGLVAIGLPIWLFLHYLKLRHWLWAVSVGAVLTFGAVYVIAMETGLFWGWAGLTVGSGVDPATLTESQLASRKWLSALLASFVLSVIGMAVAFAVWRIAYRAAPAPTMKAARSSARSQ